MHRAARDLGLGKNIILLACLTILLACAEHPDNFSSILLAELRRGEVADTPEKSIVVEGDDDTDSTVICAMPHDFIALPSRIEDYRQTHYPETEVAYWIETPLYGSLQSHSDEVWPSASIVKVFILITAYLEFRENWHETPNGLDEILNTGGEVSPSMRMFDSSARAHVREQLMGMTYRDLAVSMMGSTQNQIGNSAYNAAANILIYLLGGPEECTRKVRAICLEFNSVYIGRYMLEDRTPFNDNSNSLTALAAACRMIATEALPGADSNDCQELKDCLQTFSYMGFNGYQKRGHLSTAPSLTAWVGWMEINDQPYFYAISVLYEQGVSLEDRGANYYRDIIRDVLIGL